MKRPLHVLAALSTAAHHAFELASGVGLVFQPYLGLPGSVALWGTGIPAWAATAGRGSRRADPALAVAAGIGLSGALVHFTLWPFEWRGPVPWLTAAEGLGSRQLVPYNTILLTWAVSSTFALAKETPSGARRWALLGAAAGVPLRLSARHHFSWLRRAAAADPAWWNRAVAGAAPVQP